MPLYTRILIGLAAGALVGLAANAMALAPVLALLGALEPIGTLFIRLITMIVVPLVTASLIVGTASLGDTRRLGRLGVRTLAYYVATTAVAVTLGIVLSNLARPGARVDAATRDELSARYGGEAAARVQLAPDAPSLVETLQRIVPRNPVQAAAEMDLLPLIFFSVVFGAALGIVEPRWRAAVIDFFQGVNQASTIVIDWVMRLAPYAVFALIASVVASFGLDLLWSLLGYALVVAAGLLLHALVTYSLILRFLAGVDPRTFYRRIAKVGLLGFSTSSSNATLPVTMKTAEEDLGISRQVSSFVLPLGATINMDGTALYQAVAVMFIAQIYGVPLGLWEQALIVVTAVLASIGTAGVPAAGLVMLVIVLNAVGLGDRVAAGIALILGVDRLLDMTRTAVNITGDLVAATVIARGEGEDLTPLKAARRTSPGARST